jgi:MFS family permease
MCWHGAIGCWIVNWFSDKLGRRLAIQIIAAIYIISAALPAGSDLATDGEPRTAHQTRQTDVDRLVARRFRVGPEVGP